MLFFGGAAYCPGGQYGGGSGYCAPKAYPPRPAIRLRGAAYRRSPADTAAQAPFGQFDRRFARQMHIICIIFRVFFVLFNHNSENFA